MAKAPRVDRTPAAPPPHHGWLVGSANGGAKRTAWKDFERCSEDDQWCEDGVPRRKVVKIECGHRRQDHSKARALVRGEDEFLEQVHQRANINPCSYTECAPWKARQERSSR